MNEVISVRQQDLAEACMAADRKARPVFSSIVQSLSVLLHAVEAGELQPTEAVAVYHWK